MRASFSKSIARKASNRFHPFHLLHPSLWPIVASAAIFNMVISLVSVFYTSCIPGAYRFFDIFAAVEPSVFFSTILLGFVVFCWWSDISRESGEHTKYIIRGLKFGMALFILSEVMFFFSFFWSFFHVSLSPAIEVGGVWPPVGFESMVLSYKKVPLLNTLVLLASGVSVTYAHASLHGNFHLEEGINTGANGGRGFFDVFTGGRFVANTSLCRGINGMWATLIFAFFFIFLQVIEYFEAVFSLSDSSYGSTFFVMTGFHGLHVIIGTIFLLVCLYRISEESFFFKGSTGLECAIWYWHFVDVVWLFLYISIYWWGNICFKDASNFFYLEDLSFADAVYREGHLGFQDPASIFMEEIIALHEYVMYYLVFIGFILLSLVIEVIE